MPVSTRLVQKPSSAPTPEIEMHESARKCTVLAKCTAHLNTSSSTSRSPSPFPSVPNFRTKPITVPNLPKPPPHQKNQLRPTARNDQTQPNPRPPSRLVVHPLVVHPRSSPL